MADLPASVLFACSQNSVRSPIAEALARHLFGHRAYFDSAGLRAEDPDPFAVAALEEIGIDLHHRHGKTLEDVDPSSFELIITLSPEAHHAALAAVGSVATEVEYWPTIDASAVEGSRDARLEAYRQVRDGLLARLRRRFGATGGPTV
jgi:protein-tyrosine-phosphatase